MKKLSILACVAALLTGAALAQTDAPLAYTADGKMIFPKDYRSGVFLSSGFDMAYVEGTSQTHIFDNVFVNREAYEGFVKTGAWPDKTVLVLEVRDAGSDPFVKRGQFQSSAPPRTEAHVKDAARGGWAFYVFGSGSAPGALMPKTANCYSCHEQHAATDTTFTQFYPTLNPAK
jgi:hypothetical protein